eukprot:SAG11_NODE_25021_length_364_cov_1.656604_1_plen_44_part_10
MQYPVYRFSYHETLPWEPGGRAGRPGRSHAVVNLVSMPACDSPI